MVIINKIPYRLLTAVSIIMCVGLLMSLMPMPVFAAENEPGVAAENEPGAAAENAPRVADENAPGVAGENAPVLADENAPVLAAANEQVSAAAANEIKKIDITGVGYVYYILNPSGVETGAGEWNHVHGTVPGAGTKDFRVNLYENTVFAYYVEAYPALPVEDTLVDGTYIREAAIGGIPGTLYGTASMTHIQFWQSEGLSSSIGSEQDRILSDSSSPNKDNEGYYDLGGFDTVTRSTLTYGLGHTAFAFDNIIYGVEKTPPYAALNPPLTPNFVPVSFAGTSYTTADGSYFALGAKEAPAGGGHETTDTFYVGATEETATGYFLDKYEVPGYKAIPVSVDGVTYIENMILADAGLLSASKSAFKNVTVGGTLNNIWNGATDETSASQRVPVTANTGLLKHLGADGVYGAMADGKSEMSYEVQSNGGWATISHDYNYTWGDYTDAYVTLQPEGSAATTNALSEYQYANYCLNFLTAKYEYYGDVDDITGVNAPSDIPNLAALQTSGAQKLATYGSTYIVDTWWAPFKKARIEVGFNFDALRLGGTGISTSEGGIYNYGAAQSKTGFYKVTLYSLGHNNVEKLIYVKTQLKKPGLAFSADLKKLTLENLSSELRAAISGGAAVTLSTVDGRTATVIGTLTGLLAADGSYDVDTLGITSGTTYRLTVSAGDTAAPLTVDNTPILAESVSLSKSTLALAVGGTETLTAAVLPAGATINASVTWSTSSSGIASVDQNGKVIAVALGTATIAAALPDGSKAECDVTVSRIDLGSATISPVSDQSYTGSALTPTATVKYGESTLIKDTDYTLSYSSNTAAGTATVTATGKGNYSGTKAATFKILAASISSSSISAISDYTYTGAAVTPAVTVSYGQSTLTKDVDYTVSYSSNTAAGSASVTVTGKGNYSGTKQTAFTINAADISGATIAAIASQTYTGAALTPAVAVSDGHTLTKDVDYTVSYSSNTAAGSASVTVTGQGNYSGTKQAAFTITTADISGATISAIADQTYTGSNISPTVTVKHNQTTLAKNVDYTVSYRSNTAVGTATATITGIGNYSGTKEATYKIVAAAVTAAGSTVSGDATNSNATSSNSASSAAEETGGTVTSVNVPKTTTSGNGDADSDSDSDADATTDDEEGNSETAISTGSTAVPLAVRTLADASAQGADDASESRSNPMVLVWTLIAAGLLASGFLYVYKVRPFPFMKR